MSHIILKKTIFFIVAIIAISFATNCGNTSPIQKDIYGLNSDEVTLGKGTFLRAISQREISTATSKIGDEVRFIATMSTFAKDCVIVPAGSIYVGQIKELYSPVEGSNAAMKIEINKILFPNGTEKIINASLYSENNNLFGGEATPPAYYMKVPHYNYGWKGGGLSYQHSGIYQMGVPTVIKAGAELLIILNENTNLGNNYY